MAKSFDRQWWGDFFLAVPSEVKDHTLEVSDTIGQSLGKAVRPTSAALFKLVLAAAVLAAGIAAIVYSKEIKMVVGK